MSNETITVKGGAELEIGQTYEVRHSRKGTFTMKVTDIRGEWVDGVVTDGFANAIMDDNIKEEGEEITVRASHSYFIPGGDDAAS